MFAPFIAAIRFLTILPIPGKLGSDAESLSTSLPFFPVVGLMIGGISALLTLGLGQLFPLPVTAVGIVIILLMVSGGLHMDGLADTADGFFSSRPRERILEIMRDSHVGAMGVMAIVLTLALKIAALACYTNTNIWVPALLMPLAGRVVLVLLTAFMPYARGEGLASPFYQGPAKLAATWGIVFFTAVAWWLAGAAGMFVVVGIILFTLLFALYCHNKIGGVTGDTLGAACELAETLTVLLLIPQPVYRLLEGIVG